MSNLLRSFAVAATGLLSVGNAAVYTYTALDAFKVAAFTEGNATVAGSEAQGAVVVGGNVHLSGTSYQVKIARASAVPHNLALAVGGQLTSNSYSQPTFRIIESPTTGGPTRVSRDVAYNGIGGQTRHRLYIDNQTYTQPQTGPAIGFSGGHTIDVSGAFTDLRALSARIAATPGSQPVSYYNNNIQTPVSTAAAGTSYAFHLNPANKVSNPDVLAESFYLFTVKASDLNTTRTINGVVQNANFVLNGQAINRATFSDLIVINVVNDLAPGTTVVGGGSLDLNRLFGSMQSGVEGLADNILWNVSGINSGTGPNLQALRNGRGFIGSLLAPNSTFNHSSLFRGSLIASSFNQGNAAIQRASFGGTLNMSPIPEPTSALAGILIALGLLRRQRR